MKRVADEHGKEDETFKKPRKAEPPRKIVYGPKAIRGKIKHLERVRKDLDEKTAAMTTTLGHFHRRAETISKMLKTLEENQFEAEEEEPCEGCAQLARKLDNRDRMMGQALTLSKYSTRHRTLREIAQPEGLTLKGLAEEEGLMGFYETDWKDEKNCALCDRDFSHYESVRGGYAEKRYLAGHLVCAECFEKSRT